MLNIDPKHIEYNECPSNKLLLERAAGVQSGSPTTPYQVLLLLFCPVEHVVSGGDTQRPQGTKGPPRSPGTSPGTGKVNLPPWMLKLTFPAPLSSTLAAGVSSPSSLESSARGGQRLRAAGPRRAMRRAGASTAFCSKTQKSAWDSLFA